MLACYIHTHTQAHTHTQLRIVDMQIARRLRDIDRINTHLALKKKPQKMQDSSEVLCQFARA